VRFSEIVKEAREWLRRDGRLRYRSLKRKYDLDEEALEDLRDELMESQQVVIDKDGKMLVWTGDGATPPQSAPSQSQPQSPASYTPRHLADRIRSEQAAMESSGATDGEWKTITALFADLKGSTGDCQVMAGRAKSCARSGRNRSLTSAFSDRGGMYSRCKANNTPRIWPRWESRKRLFHNLTIPSAIIRRFVFVTCTRCWISIWGCRRYRPKMYGKLFIQILVSQSGRHPAWCPSIRYCQI